MASGHLAGMSRFELDEHMRRIDADALADRDSGVVRPRLLDDGDEAVAEEMIRHPCSQDSPCAPGEDAPTILYEVRLVFAVFDWKTDDPLYALEQIAEVVNRGQS